MQPDFKVVLMMPDNTMKPVSIEEFKALIGSETKPDLISDAYTVKETMGILKKTSAKSIYNLRKKGKIKTFGEGKALRITGDSLRTYMKTK
jgi:hypothetical protein